MSFGVHFWPIFDVLRLSCFKDFLNGRLAFCTKIGAQAGPNPDAQAKILTSLKDLSNKLGLKNIFICTDGNKELSPAEVSIIDQWICAHSKYFIGTHHSTFSFRIHEDREILGHSPETTFNRFCGEKEKEGRECEQPANWRILLN
uniref:GDP-fucose protein O-fucosyltransferase 2 n=2 Tax=Meloidogyne TaxID=189290 RepID=A0A914ME98_MELIC|nr:unnamed protein product [Meloidogyne enterolobii]